MNLIEIVSLVLSGVLGWIIFGGVRKSLDEEKKWTDPGSVIVGFVLGSLVYLTLTLYIPKLWDQGDKNLNSSFAGTGIATKLNRLPQSLGLGDLINKKPPSAQAGPVSAEDVTGTGGQAAQSQPTSVPRVQFIEPTPAAVVVLTTDPPVVAWANDHSATFAQLKTGDTNLFPKWMSCTVVKTHDNWVGADEWKLELSHPDQPGEADDITWGTGEVLLTDELRKELGVSEGQVFAGTGPSPSGYFGEVAPERESTAVPPVPTVEVAPQLPDVPTLEPADVSAGTTGAGCYSEWCPGTKCPEGCALRNYPGTVCQNGSWPTRNEADWAQVPVNDWSARPFCR